MSEFFEFIDYVWSFYGANDALYPIQGLTKNQVMEASWLYLQMCCYPSIQNMSGVMVILLIVKELGTSYFNHQNSILPGRVK